MRDLATVPITKSWPRSRADYVGIFFSFSLFQRITGFADYGWLRHKAYPRHFFSFGGNEAGVVELSLSLPSGDQSGASAPGPPTDTPFEVSHGGEGRMLPQSPH